MSASDSARLYGYLAVCVAAVLYGMWANVSKLAERSVPPLTIALWSQILPGLLYLPFAVKHGLPRGDIRLLLLIMVAGAVAAPVVFYYGLEQTTAANAALLSNSESLFTILIAFTFLGERLTRRGYVALAGIILGAFTVTTEFRITDLASIQYLAGNLLIIAATLFWGIDNNGSTVLSKRSRILPLISVKLLLGSALIVPFLVASNTPLLPSGPDAWLVLVLAFGGVASFTILFYFALRTIGAMRAGSILSTSALWGVLIAFVLFPGQVPTLTQVAGGALMILSTIALYVLGERRSAPPTAGEGETLKPDSSDGPKLP